MIFRYFLAFTLFVTVSASAQTTFQKLYGGTNKDIAYSVCETTDGSIGLLGFSQSFGTGKDMFLVSMDSLGAIKWSRSYGGDKVDVANKVKPTDDGGFVIVGNTSSFDVERKDVLLTKIRPDGSVEWARTYGGEINEYGFDVEHTTDGGYIMVGESNSFNARDHDILLIKADELGQTQWSCLIGGDSIDYAYAVHEVRDGYILGAETNSYGAGGYDAMLVKVDRQGDVMWAKTYGGVEEETLQDIILLETGDLVFVGSTLSYGHENQDMLFVWTDVHGMPKLVKTLGGINDEQALGVKKIKDDGFVICGFSNSYNELQTEEDAYIVRMNEKGNMRWSKTFGGPKKDFALAIDIHKKSGDFLITGETTSFTVSEDDKEIFLIKVDDERKIETCELTNVQTVAIKLKDEFLTNGLFIESRKIKINEKFAFLKQEEVIAKGTDICSGNEMVNESDDMGDGMNFE